MKTLINLFHPDLARSKVNRAWAERLAREPNVTVLNFMNFIPTVKLMSPQNSPHCWRTTDWCFSIRFTGIPFPH